jgi:aryl-alcohol dehydrogenase-like predicted oxidoreductase
MSQNIADVPFSRLVVGTVQFGLPYGIANRTGQPDLAEVCAILECAIEGGATTLDTAAEYGESEVVLGRALRRIGALDRVTLVSKVRRLKQMEREHSAENVRSWIRDSVMCSLEHLGVEALPLCLFHDTQDVAYIDVLLDLKREGWIQHVGVSVATPDQIEMVLTIPGVEAIQVAASVLDQRALRCGGLARAVDAGLVVFVRSIYLQGLLVMPVEQIIPELKEVVPVRQVLERICLEAGLTMPELALRYALSIRGVTGVLVGTETAAQMAENVAIAGRGPLPTDVIRAVHDAVPDLPETILFPWHWPGAIK